jgi:hypothetical protein
MHYAFTAIPNADVPRVVDPVFQHVVTMYRGEANKTVSLWRAVPVAKQIKIKDLGEPRADSTPASLIDALHRMCVFRDKGDTEGMAEFVAHSGQGKTRRCGSSPRCLAKSCPMATRKNN